MYLLGMPITVVVDDYLPLMESWDGYSTLYANVGNDGALWGTLFEKTFAKYLGQYEAIDAGQGAMGIEAMTGSPYFSFNHVDILEEGRTEELWEEMVRADKELMMITSGSYTGTGNDQDQNEAGLPFNHAFSIMRVVEVVDADGVTHRLVETRNPWGAETYFGPWSDTSDVWTDDLRQQVNHFESDDGKYYMEFADYVEYMEYTDFSRDVYGMHYAAFAFLGDGEPLNRNTVFFEDDTEYNIHTLKIYSSEAQNATISAHAYNFKHYHGACFGDYYTTEVLMEMPGTNTLYPVWPGSRHEPITELPEGELIVRIYTHFSEEDLLPFDWSLVTWSEKSKLTITHADGIESASFRNLAPDASIPIPTNFRNRTATNSTDNGPPPADFNGEEFVVSVYDPFYYDVRLS